MANRCADCISDSGYPCHTTLRGAVNIRLGCKREAMASYADYRPERSYITARDFAPDGRPLMVQSANGPIPYETYCKPQRDSE